MTNALIPFRDVRDIVLEVLDEVSIEQLGKILYRTLKFAKGQFGKRIVGFLSYYRESVSYASDVDHITHWKVEIIFLYRIIFKLGNSFN
jgi:hypothetical protein